MEPEKEEDAFYYLAQMEDGLQTNLLTEQEKLEFFQSLRKEISYVPDRP